MTAIYVTGMARSARKRPILEMGAVLGMPGARRPPRGQERAKVPQASIAAFRERPNGKSAPVAAVSPTPAGEARTTMEGPGDGPSANGRMAATGIREASPGPDLGGNGGAAGARFVATIRGAGAKLPLLARVPSEDATGINDAGRIGGRF